MAFTRPDLLKRHHGIAHSDVAKSTQDELPLELPSRAGLDQTATAGGQPDQHEWEGFMADSSYLPDPYHDFANFIDTIGLPLDYEGVMDLDIHSYEHDNIDPSHQARLTVENGSIGQETNHDLTHNGARISSTLPIPKMNGEIDQRFEVQVG